MNYLAHTFLSFGYGDLLLGNFIADALRGKAVEQYSEPIKQGIQLHRLIDNFTDHHEIVKQSKARLADKYGKYDAVIMDILYDYLLAQNWDKYAVIPLAAHAAKVYAALDENFQILPNKIKEMLPYMKQQNWLVAYGTTEGITQSLKGMAQRATFASHMDEAIEDLKENFDALNTDFQEFFPDMIHICKNFINNNEM